MLKKIRNVLLTVGSAIVSFVYIWIWTVIFGVTGILLLIDWVHKIWTNRRIDWIKGITDAWSELFDHPFGNSKF